VSLGIAFALGALLFYALTVELPYLLEREHLDGVWKWLLLVPLIMTCLCWWVTPRDLSLVLLGRTRVIVLVSAPLVPLTLLALYHLFWWITVRLERNAELQSQNAILQMEGKRYDELCAYMDASRAMRHDFRQHLRLYQS
jgi:hypothetical protein